MPRFFDGNGKIRHLHSTNSQINYLLEVGTALTFNIKQSMRVRAVNPAQSGINFCGANGSGGEVKLPLSLLRLIDFKAFRAIISNLFKGH
ncbi:MAG: hypothetical protein A3C35_01885 [Omnitrophica bacterium RIFCSPHIGHO2_02_FULL_46_11]|nr:MAG: hypothetical protein A3A81_06460 [Omnitrophica bacterium RIFCSPLOWO2_01_FULL_45_10b]OGW85611.1 MAG: hypothetical protein A3C35_01885 [Omnitrophica bacterium RIFCSPHIGHO2_02_FULL_46_11]